MPNVDNSTTAKTLADLGAGNLTEINLLFRVQRKDFDLDVSASCSDFSALENLRVKWIGRRSGVLAKITENWLKPAASELRPIVGQALNELKAHVESVLEERRRALEADFVARAGLGKEGLDLSLPGVIRPIGSHHLIRQVFQEIEDIFVSIGFSVVEGPEIETPYYNFEALNIPEFHPVRDDLDTFYLELPPLSDKNAVKTPLLLLTR